MDGETFGDAAGKAELQREGDDSSAMMMIMMGAAAGAGDINDNLPEFFNTKGTSGDQEFSRCGGWWVARIWNTAFVSALRGRGRSQMRP